MEQKVPVLPGLYADSGVRGCGFYTCNTALRAVQRITPVEGVRERSSFNAQQDSIAFYANNNVITASISPAIQKKVLHILPGFV
jgi:hypothetical protein